MTAVLLHDLWLNKHYILVRHIFGIWIEGDCSSEQFDAFFFDLGQKLSDWRNFKKKVRTPRKWWETGIYLKMGGTGSFFGNCVNRSIFVWDQKRRHQIVRKSNLLLSRYIKNGIHHIRGGAEVFFKLRQSLNFCPRSKKKASNCSEEQSPSIQIPKKLKKYIEN